jgi:hypothetical protein
MADGCADTDSAGRRAVAWARCILGCRRLIERGENVNLARQFLRALGLSEASALVRGVDD